MYPISDLLRGPSLAAPLVEGFLAHKLPALHKRKQMPSPKLPGFERIEVELSLPHAAVGVLNITGPLQSWSWAETLPHTMLPVSLLLQVVHTLHLHASLAACVGVGQLLLCHLGSARTCSAAAAALQLCCNRWSTDCAASSKRVLPTVSFQQESAAILHARA